MSFRSGTRDWQYVERLHQLRVQFGGRCKRCPRKLRYRTNRRGIRKPNLEFAHVAATLLRGPGRGARRRFQDIRDNPTCYELLCKQCHQQQEREKAHPLPVEEERVPF